jgi:hypothetical protein
MLTDSAKFCMQASVELMHNLHRRYTIA